MIQLYPKGTSDFTKNGIELAPAESEVNWQIAGRYDFTMNIPREKVAGITLDYGQILKVSVPPEHVNAISLGAVSYYTVSNASGTPLYSRVPSAVRVSYNNWQALRSYMAGDKVTYDNKNWQCVTGHGGLSVPPPNGGLWTQIAGSRMDAGSTITTLASGASLMKVRDFNATYIEAATTTGYQGFVKVADVTATGSSGTRTVPAFDITEQLFTINKIDKETSQHMIRIEAEHISYKLGRTMLGECSVVGVTPATALQFIAGAMQENYDGGLYCGIDDGTVDGDWSWKNAQSAILDPSSGLLKDIDGRIIRDDLDVYMIENAAENAVYEIAYGVNMKTVRWTGDVSGIVTRVYPIAQREDGTRITLPEKYIDSVLTVPYIRPEVLDTKLKIGQKVENSDGTETELTESEVYTRMRSQAQSRFDVDKCDQAEVTLELDFVHMPDTEEYKSYVSMTRLAPAQWVRVINGPMGVDTTIQLTEYTYDPILLKYKTTKYGKKTQKATIAGYNIKSGAVTGRTIAQGAVSGSNIAAGTITAREIEANSITAEQIASKIITAELIAAQAITATEIAANAITTEKLAAGSVTADKIGAGEITAGKIAAGAVTAAGIASGAITTDKLDAGAVTAAKIAAGTITADRLDSTTVNAAIATIANARIAAADISYAQIKALTTESLIARDAVTDRYYIAKLAVENAQLVHATVGDLVIKAADGNYYKLNIDEYGQMAPTQVTLTAGEITAGETSDGKGAIIETDLTVAELSASNMKGINALIDKLTAQRIDVDELFARSAVISALNTADISNNQSILLHINQKSANYVQWEDPNDGINELNKGDIWAQIPDDGRTIAENYDIPIEDLEDFPLWAFLYGRQYAWSGNDWQIIQDNAQTTDKITELQIADGEIRASVISLDDRMTSVETIISEDGIRDLIVQEMTEEVRQDIIDGAAGAAIDEILASKAAFVQWDTPQESADVTIRFGTLWLKDHGYRTIASASAVTISTASTWTIESFDGGRLYMYAGTSGTYDTSQWRLVDDYGKTVTKTTELDRTTEGILARVSTVETSYLGVEQRVSALEITDGTIQALVTAAQATADAAYVRQAGILIDPDGVRIKATASDGGASLLDLLRNGIKVYSGGKIEISSGATFTIASNNFSIDASGNVTMTGTVTTTSGQIGGFTIGATRLSAGSGSNTVGLDSGTANFDYAIWAGSSTASAAPFRLKRDGTLTVTKLEILDESGSSADINLRNYALWKLNYNTVKQVTSSGGYASSMQLSNGTTVNFKSATAGWGEAVAKVGDFDLDEGGAWISIDVPSATYGQQTSKGYDLTAAFGRQYSAGSPKGVTIGSRVSGTMYAATVTRNDDTTVAISAMNCSTPYNQGWNDALAACGISGGGTVYTGSVRQLYDPSLDVYVNAVNPYYSHFVNAK